MAEALQIAGAAFGVADLAFKIYKELSTFVERARDADITAKSLTVRIQRFRRVVEIVHLTAARRRTVVSLGLEHRDEGKIWSAISDSLNGWETALARFKAGIEASHLGSSQETKVNWIGKALLQLKLDRKNPWIERLEIDIGTHIDEISLSLNCLQIIIVGDTTSHVCRLDQRLERLTRSSTRKRSFSSRKSSPTGHKSEKQGAVLKCVEVARSIRSRSSIYSESAESLQLKGDSFFDNASDLEAVTQRHGANDAEETEFDDLISSSSVSPPSIWSQGESTCSSSSYNISSVIPIDDDPTPDFDDTTPQEILDTLIPNYKKQVQVEIGDVCYVKAAKYQRKLIDCVRESNESYASNYNIQEMRRNLAEILYKIDDDRSRQEAKDINTSLFRPAQHSPTIPQGFPVAIEPEAGRLEHADLYLQRAELFCQEFQKTFKNPKTLERSEMFAKRSLKLTLALGDCGKLLLQRSVEHLIKVYQLKHDNVAAQTYRDLFPKSRIGLPYSLSSESLQIIPTTSSGHSQAVQKTVRPEEPDSHDGVDSKEQTQLVSAILNENLTEVERLLQQGADPNQSSRGKSPLMYAIDCGIETIVMKLRDRGANINTGPGSKSPLNYAIEKRAEKMVKLLCQLGVDVEASPRKSNLTPLLRAAQLKNPGMVRTLCQHGAKVNARCSDEYSALHYAVSIRYGPSRDKVCEILEILLKNNADPNAKDVEGKSPLHHAIQVRDETCVRFMLDSSWPFDLEAKDNRGRTPLYFAIDKRDYPLVELCLSKNPHIPERLPRDTSKPLQELINRKRRESTQSNDSAARTSSEAAPEHPPFGSLYRSFSTVAHIPASPPKTSIFRRWSLFGKGST